METKKSSARKQQGELEENVGAVEEEQPEPKKEELSFFQKILKWITGWFFKSESFFN